MSAVIAPPAALTSSTSEVLCAPVFLLSTAPVVTALSRCPSMDPGTPNASACPVAMPPVAGSVATGDCATMPATFTYVPNALPVTLWTSTPPARRVRATRIFRVMVVLLESSVIAGQAVLLDVAARQKSVTRVHVADRDLDVIIADARFSDIARVIHLEGHILEGPAVACIQPAHAAEAPTARITRGFVRRGREERHPTVEGEASAQLVP